MSRQVNWKSISLTPESEIGANVSKANDKIILKEMGAALDFPVVYLIKYVNISFYLS